MLNFIGNLIFSGLPKFIRWLLHVKELFLWCDICNYTIYFI